MLEQENYHTKGLKDPMERSGGWANSDWQGCGWVFDACTEWVGTRLLWRKRKFGASENPG